jgi:hypothetical protein
LPRFTGHPEAFEPIVSLSAPHIANEGTAVLHIEAPPRMVLASGDFGVVTVKSMPSTADPDGDVFHQQLFGVFVP